MNIENKLAIFMEKKQSAFKYNRSKLLDSIVFFCYHNLKHISKEDLPQIHIEIDGPNCTDMTARGCIVVVKSNIVTILISTYEIKKAVDQGIDFPDYLKAFFHTLLHELSHTFTLINTYLQTNRENSLEDYYEEINIAEGLDRKRRKDIEGFYSPD